MLETLLDFVQEQLTPEAQADLEQRHADYLAALAERAEPELSGPDRVAWFGRLSADYDNIRAALTWCEERRDDTGAGLRLAGALGSYWLTRNRPEGARWLRQALACMGGSDSVRAKALARAA